ncbi:hypothetical protein MW887_008702 [Aspergillus wentii]|nr:hypothetical protein MW887_008702 [Aspergillus wentii]
MDTKPSSLHVEENPKQLNEVLFEGLSDEETNKLEKGPIFIWGGIFMTMAATNFAGIIRVRVFLGFAESPFFPGALLLISSWYKPSEIAVRVAIVYCGNTVANGFGGLIAAGILSGLDGKGGLAGWR